MAGLPPAPPGVCEREVWERLDGAAGWLASAARRPGIDVKREVLYSLSQGLESLSRAVRQISASLTEAGYGPEVTDPVARAGSSVFAAMTATENAMHAVGSLADLKLRDAGASGRQIPHHSELNGVT